MSRSGVQCNHSSQKVNAADVKPPDVDDKVEKPGGIVHQHGLASSVSLGKKLFKFFATTINVYDT